MSSIPRQLLLQVILILLNAFFAAAEIAVVSLNGTKLRRLEEEGDKKAGKLLKLVEEPASFLSTIQVGITLAGFLGSAFAADKMCIRDRNMLGKISRIAVPSILQQSFISIGNIFIQGLINSFGSSVIAGYSAAIKLNTFAITSLTTLGNGTSSFTAQNLGAGKQGRVKAGFGASVKLALIITVPFFAAFFFGSHAMLSLFMNEGSTVAMETGIEFLRIVAPFYFVISLKLMADGVLRGAGAMKAFMTATFTDLLLRVILAFILAGPFGTLGIWLSWPIGWVVAMVLSLSFYKKGVWKDSALTDQEEEAAEQETEGAFLFPEEENAL